ncbi:MAG TPA: hypothetical protein VGC22_10445 [Chitinophaga sp.]
MVQFCISVILIVSIVIMQRQLSYIQNKNIGYNREQVLVLPMDDKITAKIQLIKQEFAANPNVLGVSGCENTPVNIKGVIICVPP